MGRQDDFNIQAIKKHYLFEHTVSFEETNVVGNVYFANHVRWQGKCREMFLLEHCPEVLEDINGTLRLVTLKVSCDYYEELHAFDELKIRMRLVENVAHRIVLGFEYFKIKNGTEKLAAIGRQEIGCMRMNGEVMKPCSVPDYLSEALDPFRC